VTSKTSQSPIMRQDSLDVHRLSSKQIMKRMVKSYILPHKKILFISFTALLFVALTTSAIPLLIQRITDDLFVERNTTALTYLPLAIILIMGVKALSEYIATNTEAYVAFRIVADIRIEIFEAISKADLRWLQSIHSGRLQSSFLHDTEIIRDSAARVLVALGKNFLKVVVLLANMVYLNWQLSISILIMLPIAIVFLGTQRKKMRRETKKTMEKTADTSTLLSETMSAIPVIKAYGMEKFELARITIAINDAFTHRINAIRIRSASSPITEIIVAFGLALAIYIAGRQGIDGSLTAGEFTGFLTAVMLLYQPLKSLAILQTSLQEGVSASNRVFTILDQIPNVSENSDLPTKKLTKGDIQLNNIFFDYEADQNLFNNLSLTIRAGSRAALVGTSGSGKTTIFNLIMRFYDPDQGQVLIDGQDISQLPLHNSRAASALVTQSPILFDMSIRDNICYGQENISDEAIMQVLKEVALDRYVQTLENGVNTLVGEAGDSLSGGQRQRITLARALLSKAPILLLDEPTSALDNETEIIIQKTLDDLHGKRTVLIIAHRLQTIKNADNIFVLEKGKLVESGNHQNLMDAKGRYYTMATTHINS